MSLGGQVYPRTRMRRYKNGKDGEENPLSEEERQRFDWFGGEDNVLRLAADHKVFKQTGVCADFVSNFMAQIVSGYQPSREDPCMVSVQISVQWNYWHRKNWQVVNWPSFQTIAALHANRWGHEAKSDCSYWQEQTSLDTTNCVQADSQGSKEWTPEAVLLGVQWTIHTSRFLEMFHWTHFEHSTVWKESQLFLFNVVNSALEWRRQARWLHSLHSTRRRDRWCKKVPQAGIQNAACPEGHYPGVSGVLVETPPPYILSVLLVIHTVFSSVLFWSSCCLFISQLLFACVAWLVAKNPFSCSSPNKCLDNKDPTKVTSEYLGMNDLSL